MTPPAHEVVERDAFDALFEALSGRGYTIVGPAVRDQAIVYDDLRSSTDLPNRGGPARGGRAASRRASEKLRLRCEQAIRNHDPCISCATHFLDLTIERG